MSRVKERLKQYKWELEKQTQYKQGLPGSALDIVNTLLADLEEDEKKKGWIPAKEKPTEYGQYLVTFKKNTKVYIAEYGICQMPVTVLGQPIGCGWYSSTGYYYAEDSIVAWIALKKLLMIFRRTIPEIHMKWNGGSRLRRKCQKNIILYLQNGKAQNIGAMQCLKRDPMRCL